MVSVSHDKPTWVNPLKHLDMKCHSCKCSWYYSDWKQDKCPVCDAKIYSDSFEGARSKFDTALIGLLDSMRRFIRGEKDENIRN